LTLWKVLSLKGIKLKLGWERRIGLLSERRHATKQKRRIDFLACRWKIGRSKLPVARAPVE
jgi:hypothetical protein